LNNEISATFSKFFIFNGSSANAGPPHLISSSLLRYKQLTGCFCLQSSFVGRTAAFKPAAGARPLAVRRAPVVVKAAGEVTVSRGMWPKF
jgi:hypothetical protein